MTLFPMIYLIPPDDRALLTERVMLLVRNHSSKKQHAFLHLDSTQGIAEQVAEKYDMELADAKNIVVALAAKAAMPIVAAA